MSKRIRVTPYAGTGNRMFQYMLALALQHHVPEARIYGVRLPEWGIEMPATPPQSGPSVTLKHHSVPFSQVVRTMLSVDRIDINLTRLQCRMEYYQDLLPTYRRTFPAAPQQGGGDSELVFHVRAGDILSGSHKTYMPAPLGFFEMLLRTTGLAPVFVGQIGDDRYSEALRRRFPEARFIRHQDPLKDFHVLRNSAHLVPSVGTFGWLASGCRKERRRSTFRSWDFSIRAPVRRLISCHEMMRALSFTDRTCWHGMAARLTSTRLSRRRHRPSGSGGLRPSHAFGWQFVTRRANFTSAC